MLIQDAAFNRKLIDDGLNQEQAALFLEKGTELYHVPTIDLSKFDNYELLISAVDHKYEGQECKKIRLIHFGENGPEIVYAVNLVLCDHVYKGKHCTQVMVWRKAGKAHRAVLRDLPMLMFEHFIQEYVVIVSDDEQTEQGRGFWVNRVYEAIEDNMHVYFVDLNELSDDLVPVLNPIHTVQEFNDVWNDHGWGKTEEYKDRLFVISTEDIAN